GPGGRGDVRCGGRPRGGLHGRRTRGVDLHGADTIAELHAQVRDAVADILSDVAAHLTSRGRSWRSGCSGRERQPPPDLRGRIAPVSSSPCSAPAPTRTGDLQVRSLTLYPAELRAHAARTRTYRGDRRESRGRGP